MKHKILSIFILFLFFSCSSETNIEENPIDFEVLNEERIQEYIKENNLNPEKTNSGLYYIIKENGTGSKPDLSSNVTVQYRLYDTFNITIQETKIEGEDIDLNQVIEGFKEGINLISEGGKITLIVPSKLAYSEYKFHPLRYKVLVFDIILIKVN